MGRLPENTTEHNVIRHKLEQAKADAGIEADNERLHYICCFLKMDGDTCIMSKTHFTEDTEDDGDDN